MKIDNYVWHILFTHSIIICYVVAQQIRLIHSLTKDMEEIQSAVVKANNKADILNSGCQYDK